MAPQSFHVQSQLDSPESFDHHQSVALLWQKKWRIACSEGTYPFVHGNVDDFDPIFDTLIQQSDGNTDVLFNADRYASAFLPVGARLVSEAYLAEAAGEKDKARDLFLRASAVYRIARFPVTREDAPANWQAWEEGKKAYLRGAQYFDAPVSEVSILFRHANTQSGDTAADIPAYLRVPGASPPASGWPVVVFIGGLDSYRTDQTTAMDQHLKDGIAVLGVEIPGTGDCPAARNDPQSPDRWFGDILDWIAGPGKEHGLDAARVVARGISTGGYYALRVAHTHASRLLAAIGQGAWAHYALSAGWIEKTKNGEYPFALAESFAYKLGYESISDALVDNIQSRFSLLESGVLQQDCCPVLLVNGWEDTVFPIEDTLLAASHGKPKTVRLVEGVGHMGRPEGEEYLNQWLVEMIAASYR